MSYIIANWFDNLNLYGKNTHYITIGEKDMQLKKKCTWQQSVLPRIRGNIEDNDKNCKISLLHR